MPILRVQIIGFHVVQYDLLRYGDLDPPLVSLMTLAHERVLSGEDGIAATVVIGTIRWERIWIYRYMCVTHRRSLLFQVRDGGR